jgi:hypothetical protein
LTAGQIVVRNESEHLLRSGFVMNPLKKRDAIMLATIELAADKMINRNVMKLF